MEIDKVDFFDTWQIIFVEEAKKLIGDKLFLRVTVDKDFKLSDWTDLGVPLYLNKLLPGNSETNKVYEDVLKQLQKDKETSKRRRNRYLNYQYNGTPVRVCVGDTEAKRVKNRYPVYLNVVIIHRNALVCGSWYLDDKLLIE